MKLKMMEPPRIFTVGKENNIHIRHCADISLEANEQVTLVTPSGTEYDVVRKSWGYYATPSLNGRLRDFCLRAVLVRNKSGRLYLLLVEEGSEAEFQAYLANEQQVIVCWLDSDEAVQKLQESLKGKETN